MPITRSLFAAALAVAILTAATTPAYAPEGSGPDRHASAGITADAPASFLVRGRAIGHG